MKNLTDEYVTLDSNPDSFAGLPNHEEYKPGDYIVRKIVDKNERASDFTGDMVFKNNKGRTMFVLNWGFTPGFIEGVRWINTYALGEMIYK